MMRKLAIAIFGVTLVTSTGVGCTDNSGNPTGTGGSSGSGGSAAGGSGGDATGGNGGVGDGSAGNGGLGDGAAGSSADAPPHDGPDGSEDSLSTDVAIDLSPG
jgi:hypothetical protein